MNSIKKKYYFTFFAHLISLIITLILTPNKYEDFNHQLNFNLVIIAILNVIIFFRFQYPIIKSYISLELFFVIGYIVVHFQIPFLASIGVEPSRPDLIWINKRVVNYATWLSVTIHNMVFG